MRSPRTKRESLVSAGARACASVLALALVTCAGKDGLRDERLSAAIIARPTTFDRALGLARSNAERATEAGRLEALAPASDAPRASAPSDADASCPTGMAIVDGSYCPIVEQTCLRWLDPPGKYHQFRCEAYAAPSKCKAERVPMRFCIDVDEQRGPSSIDARADNHVSYVAARAACEARGARVCREPEWQFACEGEEGRPYPYGFVRDATACNIDNFELGKGVGHLIDLRSDIGANERCVSPFGVRDLAGNLEEWATGAPGGHPTLLKGSWWLPGKSTCRATNAGHDEVYQGTETGYRCCADAR